ncbi:unnamed protein product [Closterium sp. NIES-65]|nr:unnamed protein product [Closterium sp. NIES-65]CAI5973637.1 unnamed protein product [Closterium sp. NIES-65]
MEVLLLLEVLEVLLVLEVLEVLLEVLLVLEVLEVLLVLEVLELLILEVLEVLLVLEVSELLVLEVLLVLEMLELLVLEVQLVLEVLVLLVLEALGLEVLEVLELLVLEVLVLEVLELPELVVLLLLEVLLVLEALELEVLEVLELPEQVVVVVLEVLEVLLELLALEVLEVLLVLEALELEVLEVLEVLELLVLEVLVLEVLELPEQVVLLVLEVLEMRLELLVLEVLELLVLACADCFSTCSGSRPCRRMTRPFARFLVFVSTGLTPPILCPPTDQSQPQLLPVSPLPAPAPHTEHFVLPEPPASSLPHVPNPESDLARASSPTVSRLLATVVTDPDFESTTAFALVTELVDFATRSRLDYVASLVTESDFDCPPFVGGEPALGSDVLEDRQFQLECLATALPRFASMVLCPEGDPDALDILTPRSYAEAIAGEYSSQWQTAMDAKMASWKSTCTYVDEVPPSGANIADAMWMFRVIRPPCSPPAFKARYVARGFNQRLGVDFFQTFSPTPKMTTLQVLLHVAAQHDYELHSLDFSTTFLQGSLHEEIWLRRPLGFTGSFPAGTQWSLRRPVYGLRQAPRE